MLQQETDSVISYLKISDSALVLPDRDTVAKSTADTSFRFSDANKDSVYASDYSDDPAGFSLFKGHMLQPSASNPVPRQERYPDWFTIILIMVIAYLTWIRVFNYKIIKQHFAAIASNSLTNQIVRDENILVQKTSVFLSVVFYFSVALFLYQVSVVFRWDYKIFNDGFPRYVIFVLLIASAYSLKMVLLKVLSIIFQIDRTVSVYIFNIFLINNIIGIIFIPLIVLIAFVSASTHVLVWTGIALLLSGFLYRLFRGVILWTSIPRFSWYYLILYLCALEIAPLLILFKLAEQGV